MIKYSVVIPLYNKAHTIVRTINSVLSQVYTNFEIIIIDDGSTDDSIDLINKNFNDYRIKIFSQRNLGVSAARNMGIRLSQGDYIAFLDADDEWMPYYLKIITDSISSNPNCGLIHVPAFHRDIISGFGLLSVVKQYKGKISEIDLFKSAYNLCAQTSGIIIKRNIFEQFQEQVLYGFPENMTYEEDMTCFFSYALYTPSLYIGFPLSIRNNNVKGQLVSSKKIDVIIPCQANYLNYLLNSYITIGKKNKSFMSFFRYELRTRISSSLKESRYELFYNILSNDVKNIIPTIEWKLYKSCMPLYLKRQILKVLRLNYYIKKQKYNFY